jgi:mRNA-degrading endonuclease toxin of MazEF toxin-antitoxin module
VRPYRLTLTVIAVFMLAAALGAQNPLPPQALPEPPQNAPARQARAALVPLEVQVVISRYQGEKRISSMPYVLAVNANGERASLNMGADVAIPTTSFTPVAPVGDGKSPPPSPLRSYNYRNIGTAIVCGATTTADDGRFEVNISVDDSSVFMKEDGAGSSSAGEMPAFRTFKSRNTLLLRDGQLRQYTAATDRVSSETIRIDVTLKVVK